jgi:HSP20 family molecular chaperone IbpA
MLYSLEATDTQYIVKTPLPGHDVKDVNVSVKKNHLLIETRQDSEEEVPHEKVRKIRSFGEFFWNKPRVELMIPVHEEIDPNTVQAKLSRGILTVTFTRTPGTKVEVQE